MRPNPPLLLPLSLLLLLVLLSDPVLANKFETISGGLNGSFRVKRAFVQNMLLYGGGGFLLAAVLALVVPHSNPVFLNYANWKTSALVLALIGSALLISFLFV